MLKDLQASQRGATPRPPDPSGPSSPGPTGVEPHFLFLPCHPQEEELIRGPRGPSAQGRFLGGGRCLAQVTPAPSLEPRTPPHLQQAFCRYPPVSCHPAANCPSIAFSSLDMQQMPPHARLVPGLGTWWDTQSLPFWSSQPSTEDMEMKVSWAWT